MVISLICVAIYLLIGIILLVGAIRIDGRVWWALPIFPLLVVAWPYFLIRSRLDN